MRRTLTEPRCVRMERESALDAIVFQQIFAAADLFEDFGRQIFAIEQEAELRFVERRIVEKREQDIGGVVMDECGEVVAGRGEDFAVLSGSVAVMLLPC